MLDLKRNEIAAVNGKPERLVFVCVISTNDSLAGDCHDCLTKLRSAGYRLEQHRDSDVPEVYDIYVWDRDTIPTVPAAVNAHNSSAKIVIVNKTSLSSLRREIHHTEFTYLRSPVTTPSLKEALSRAITRLQPVHAERNGLSQQQRDRDEILQELFEAKRKLQDYEQDRSNFAARVEYDVCVPLTAVQGYCGLLLASQLGTLNSDQTQALERMQHGLGKLWKSVEAIGGLGQPAQMGTRLKLGNAAFEECLQEAVHEVLPVLEKKQISIRLDIEPPSQPLCFDSRKMEQVLVNLLENSCKFSPRSSSITVRARTVRAGDLSNAASLETVAESPEAYRVDISDSGAEVGAECIQEMFDEHASCGSPTDRAGRGLGLAFCRMIVKAHKGKIWATSNSQGTTFSLLLPAANATLKSHPSQIAV